MRSTEIEKAITPVMAFFFWNVNHGRVAFAGLHVAYSLQRKAITSISTNASFGKRAACTVERAGGAAVK